MKDIPDKSINMILCDLPYGTTSCKWDTIIPFKPLWEQYNRIIKDNGVIILFGQQPFTSELIHSNLEMFRHNLIWEKDKCGNFIHAKNQPRKICEDIIVFSKKGSGFVHNAKHKCTYNPQLEDRKPRKRTKETVRSSNLNNIREGNFNLKSGDDFKSDKNYPSNLIYSITEHFNRLHPTQKPTELYKYLAETYSNKGDVILDNCCGSGTIKVAEKIGRNYIGIEKDKNYYDIACKRVLQTLNKKVM